MKKDTYDDVSTVKSEGGMWTEDEKDIESKEYTYTMFGMEDFVNDDGEPEVVKPESVTKSGFAKKITGRNNQYFAKMGNNGLLFNPLGIDQGKSEKSFHNIPQYTMRRINKACFEWYLMYLKTKNAGHYNQANRELF